MTRAGAVDVLLAPEVEVGDDVEVVAEREVLVDGRDAQRRRVLGAGDADTASPRMKNSPSSAQLHAGDGLDERRLAGAVVADEGDHLTGVDFEVDAGEGLQSTEPLAHALEREKVRSLSWSLP